MKRCASASRSHTGSGRCEPAMERAVNRRGTCLTALALVALASRAQTARAQEAAQQLDRVEVVGSHLKRADTETPTPISIYSRDEIAVSGAVRIGDFLLALPFAGAGGFDDRATPFDFHLGAAALS